ncbi:hypothetical protein BS78_10G149600 [Paspalum vaginatum]|nr:hypothetical protein BS78_10G149600 [Paspalum vaginatum]KAJ1259375.1 hypothetical protein BS78_10G149600 [Paspalum vaginatum]
MRTLLQSPVGGVTAGAVGSGANTLASQGSGPQPSSLSQSTPTSTTPPPTDTSFSPSTSDPPSSSPSSDPPPPSPSSSTPLRPSPSTPPPLPPAAASPPSPAASSPPPSEASSPPPPATLSPQPWAPVPTATPLTPLAVVPAPPDNFAPPPSSMQALPPPSAPLQGRSHATPPSSSTSPPIPAAQPVVSPTVTAPPPPPPLHSTVDYAPPPPTRTSSIPAMHSPTAVDSSSTPPPSSNSGLSSGATAAVAIVVVIIIVGFASVFVCLSKRRRRKQADRYYGGFAVPSYTPQHLSGEAPFLHPPSNPGSMNFSMGTGVGQGMSTPMCQTYSQQPWAQSANYSVTTGSQGPARSIATTASGDLSVGNTKALSFDELYDITGGFARENVLGEGGFGCVFKGTLGDGKVVAVKQLKGGGGQGEREFQAEVEIISRVHHRHLVSLVGYCIAEDHRLLVYDYVSNNTLHHHLHGRGRPVMDWSTRIKIAAGSARGLAYLHEDCHPRIIHRDIKSSNILLDDQFEAQVADFGLARLAENDVTHISTRVMGTFGYLAPEYASTGKLTEKSDVFSFGVVLLELITGRKPVDSSRPLGDESLVEWSRTLLNRAIENQEFDELVDPRLDGNYDDVEMFRVIEAAAACIRHSAARRPKMGQVVRVLDCLTDVDLSNGVQPGKSQMFNIANTADIRQFQRMAFGSQDFSSD